MKRIIIAIISFLIITCFQCLIYSQSITIHLVNYKAGNISISSLYGERVVKIDSIKSDGTGGDIFYNANSQVMHNGIYRITFGNNKMIDFIHDGKDIELKTDFNNILDSMKVIDSESNKLFHSFIKLNKQYKTKAELLQLMLVRYPKDDSFYSQTKKRLQELKNEYVEFVNVTAQKEPNSFIAKYIQTSQLPIVDSEILPEKQLAYLKAHALDNVDFSNSSLINSDAFSNKSIEYLTYFRNPQLPKELLEKEFMKAVDTLLNKAKVNHLVYQHIIEYLIDGFKKFGFDKILDYIVENYVIKDDLCLDVKTEGMIKRRIEQAKIFKLGTVVPDFTLPDVKGSYVALSSIKAEKIFIVFYASWCPHCKELLPKLNELVQSKRFPEVKVVAISLDNKKEEWISFINEKCAALTNLSDLNGWEGKTANDYCIYATPTMFLLDGNRKIVSKPMTIEDVNYQLSY